jgi:hypothetical protein
MKIKTEKQTTPSKKIMYVNKDDKAKLIEYGKLIQDGKLKLFGFSMDQFIYYEI